MNTIKKKKKNFKVTHAKTERFKNSPVIAMQRLLNQNE